MRLYVGNMENINSYCIVVHSGVYCNCAEGKALELSKGQRNRFKNIVRVYFIADYGYQYDTEGVYQIMAGECAPLEDNINTYLKSLSY